MPNIICRCGESIEDITIPNPNGSILISEEAIDQIEQKICNPTQIFDALSEKGQLVYSCPSCSRLLVFPNGKKGPMNVFRPES